MPIPAMIRRRAPAFAFAAALAAAAIASSIVPMNATAGEAMILETDPAPLTVRTAQGEFSFTIEVADESSEQAMGLMHREEMAAGHGMLFDFGRTRPVTMWMKNTPMSLDMVFIRADGTVAGIAERTTPFSEDIVASPEPVAFVLELRGGVARLVGLKAGDRLAHPLFGD